MRHCKIKTRFAYFAILGTLLIIAFAHILKASDVKPESVNIYRRSSCRVTGERWIVTSSSQLHAKDIEEILQKLDWNLIVLGDRETPINWLTHFSSSKLLYLSYDEQMHSGLESARFISVSTRAQRNVGYLVAIFCGARTIYELDERVQVWDSKLEYHPNIVSPREVSWIGFSALRSHFLNIYGIFGQPFIWPRGLPVSEVRKISEDGWSSVRRNDNESIYPYIQQQLIDYHPDVDSITQDLRRMHLRKVSFDNGRGSIAVEPLTFSPFNAKSTFYHFEAFWGLYLPVNIHPSNADIWRSYFTQRLLWDIGGHLVFTPLLRTVSQMKTIFQYTKYEQIFNAEVTDFVHFLYSWKSNSSQLSNRIEQLMIALKSNKFIDESEYSAMEAWLNDLHSIRYVYPQVRNNLTKNKKSTIQTRRAAVCVTGLAECIEEVWSKNEMAIRKRINGDLDVFLFLSSGDQSRENSTRAIDNVRLQQARLYNATVNIVHQDAQDIDPGFPSTCNYYYIFTKPHKIIPIEQERLAQANCYRIVREYEKKRNIKYQLLIRARTDSIFTRLPQTFERKGKYNPDLKIIVPNEHHYHGINDRFAIGPMESMKHYMSRWHQLPLCLTENVHPESFLAFILDKNNIKVAHDIESSLVQVPHGINQCH